MKLPRMTEIERAVFAACYAQYLADQEPSVDNQNSEVALDQALWSVKCFRQAVRERKP